MRISSSIKALVAGISGTALQWYDFAIFGYFASVIAATYFPSGDQFSALLSAFSVFAVGYILSPLGAVFFGYIGDRYGRKHALTLSILAMAIPTAMIGLVPSYQAIGVFAPLAITFLRILQGFVASAEFTGSAVFLVEHAPSGKKALYGCLTSSAYSTGLILAGLVASFLSASFMPVWGWRLGFVLALIAGVLIFWLRTHVAETPEYQKISPVEKPRLPFLTAIKESPLSMLGVAGISWLVSIITFGTYVFAATYLHMYFKIPMSQATLIITVALTVDAILEPFVAMLADRVGHKKIIQFGMVLILMLSMPVFLLLSTGNLLLIVAGMIMMSILIAITYAPLNAYMVAVFPHQYRYSGFGVAFNTGISIFGGTTPLVMMWLVNKSGSFVAPAWYYMFGAMVGWISLVICEYARNKFAFTNEALIAS